MIPNMNPETGIRYGVIACNSLDSELVNELMFGAQAKDLSYQAAYDEAKAEAKREYENLVEQCKIAAAETGADREADYDYDRFEERWFEKNGHEHDPEQFVEDKLERFSDMCQIDEPTIEGEYEGVKYRISYLGGAPILYVFEGPRAGAMSLCSPCIPGAADLDNGFVLYSEVAVDHDGVPEEDHGMTYACYGVPRDWLHG